MRYILLFASMSLTSPYVVRQGPGCGPDDASCSTYHVRIRNPRPANVEVWLDCGPSIMPVGPFELLRHRTTILAISVPEGATFGPCQIDRWTQK